MKTSLLKDTLTQYAGAAAITLGLVPSVLELFIAAYEGSAARKVFDAMYFTSLFCACYWFINTMSRVCSRAWHNFEHEEDQRACIRKAEERQRQKKERRERRAAQKKKKRQERRAAQRSHKPGSQSE
jgi:amino acid permease